MHASRLPAGVSAFLAAARRGLAPERQPAAIQELGVGIGSGVALSNLSATAAGSTDNLRVTLTFPSGAGNTLQTQSSTINFTFNGAQRAAGNA